MSWADFYEQMWGHRLDDPQGEEKVKLLKRVAEDFVNVLDKQGNAIIRQVVLEAQKAGVPSQFYPYVFFSLMEQMRAWPRMSKWLQDALKMVKEILFHSGKTPSYSSSLKLPDVQMEEAVETTLEALALWGGTKFTATLLGEFSELIKKYKPALGKIQPDLDRQLWDDALHTGLLETARDRPHTLPDGLLLNRVLEVIL